MGGMPKGSDAKKCVDALCDEFGWTYHPSKGGRAHPAGALYCSEHSTEGCRINVASTGNNTARKVWAAARRCTHGCKPTRNQW